MSASTLSQQAAWFALIGVWWAASATPVAAVSTNGLQTLKSGTICAFGGRGNNTPYKLRGAGGLPGGGAATSGIVQVQGQFGTLPVPTAATFTKAVSVTGTVLGTPETVVVNGVAASVQGTGFSASVTLSAGRNTITAVATYANGAKQTHQITVVLDVPVGQQVPRGSTLVEGTAVDANTVTVNGVAATLAAGQFNATIPLHAGYNTITAVAADLAGNASQHVIGVFVPTFTSHPAMPTVEPTPAVATQSSTTLQGTKVPGTTVWVNGQAVAGDAQASSWQLDVTLVEGDNEFVMITTDANGVSSAQVRVVIVLDVLAPVVTFDPPAKTNYNPVLLQGTVDDHLTTVMINGQPATLQGRTFHISLPLAPGTPGTYPLNLTVTSPNSHTTNINDSVVLGTVPSIQTVSPTNGSIVIMDIEVLIQATATDEDAILYRALFDGVPLGGWTSTLSQPWVPSTTQDGVHALQIEATDGYGGAAQESVGVFTIHRPISHP